MEIKAIVFIRTLGSIIYMKNTTIIFFLILVPIYLIGQDFNKLYYNDNWHISSIDSASYYRISGFNIDIPSFDGRVTDYYYGTDSIQMVGYYVNGQKDGEFILYYPNGNMKAIVNFKNGKRSGLWREFFENGVTKIELNYFDGKEILVQLNDIKGHSIIRRNKIDYTFSEFERTYNRSKVPILKQYKGGFRDNLRNGKWEVFENGKSIALLNYEDGDLVKGTMFINNVGYPIVDKLAYPLIDLQKFTITESFSSDRGVYIKNNYVLEGLHNNAYLKHPKVSINSTKKLESYINDQFILRSYESEITLTITVVVNNGTLRAKETKPRLSEKSLKELNLVLNRIEYINNMIQDTLSIQYIIEVEEQPE